LTPGRDGPPHIGQAGLKFTLPERDEGEDKEQQVNSSDDEDDAVNAVQTAQSLAAVGPKKRRRVSYYNVFFNSS